MSIKLNGKTIAGYQKIQLISDATSETAGIVKLATAEDIAQDNNTTAVTPAQLNDVIEATHTWKSMA